MSIYLDNAATSFPKPESVYRAVERAMRHAGGNPGRGGHRFSLDAGREVLETRETLARFFAVEDAARIVFTSGATEGINLALFGLLQPGDRVVTTSMEHNALMRPLYALQQRGIEVEQVKTGRDGIVDVSDLQRACRVPTRLLAIGHCSNVSGSIQPLETIIPWCREHGILTLVDAAQSAGHLPLSVNRLGVHLLAVPGHKGLLGPSGTGFLYVDPELRLEPLLYGGTGINSTMRTMPEDLPERLEAGTLNVPGLAGLRAGVEYLQQQGPERLETSLNELVERLLAGLEAVPGVTLYGPARGERRGNVVSFNLAGMDPAEVGYRLEQQFGICVRVGLHCAPDAHRSLGSFPGGTVRVSPGIFTSPEQVEKLLTAVALLSDPSARNENG
ncbi:cysteine desulfurase [Geothermobacter hydrogeniphilus]|uniref:cysteine desulfurase n=1 Tax=Geothermobacter hydrogeniphilus TaxID=1969733 RepID=A0A2K2H9J5_9BACT|nr:aminotransferase class V-fold PLP-dependent enzyme [Geothermobacter hydrogeniphilus]PNU19903.1 cysteine desulfurase [Geothermobacter hydrogeniphilus]